MNGASQDRMWTGRRGSVLLVVLGIAVLIAAALTLGLSLLAAQTSLAGERDREDSLSWCAEGGLQWALSRLDRDPSFRGVEGRRIGEGSFDLRVSVVAGRPTAREVRVTVRVPGPGSMPARATIFAVVEPREDHGTRRWGLLSWTPSARE